MLQSKCSRVSNLPQWDKVGNMLTIIATIWRPGFSDHGRIMKTKGDQYTTIVYNYQIIEAKYLLLGEGRFYYAISLYRNPFTFTNS